MPLPTVVDAHSGDPILLITDHYRVSNWDDLAAALKTQADIEGDRASGWVRLLACADGLTRQSVSINLGKREDRIELFYKTQKYADQGRPWFEALAGKSVEFAGRVLSDPRSAMKHPQSGNPASSATTAPNLPPEVLVEAIEKVLRRTYANWSDEPVPALGGKTPRQALATAAGRERVRGLLRSYEAGEKVQAAQQGRREISFAFLWEALELDRAAE
ncbi:MAG: MbcA/ParS/Xre antitoxin family protein [Pseudomonadota bacterium]